MGTQTATRSRDKGKFKFVVFRWEDEYEYNHAGLEELKFFPDKPEIEPYSERLKWTHGMRSYASWPDDKSIRKIHIHGLAVDKVQCVEMCAELSAQIRRENDMALDTHRHNRHALLDGLVDESDDDENDADFDQMQTGDNRAEAAQSENPEEVFDQPRIKRRRGQPPSTSSSSSTSVPASSPMPSRGVSSPTTPRGVSSSMHPRGISSPLTPRGISFVCSSQSSMIALQSELRNVDKVLAADESAPEDVQYRTLALNKVMGEAIVALSNDFRGFIDSYQKDQSSMKKAMTTSMRSVRSVKESQKDRPSTKELISIDADFELFAENDPKKWTLWMNHDVKQEVNGWARQFFDRPETFGQNIADQMYGTDLACFMMKKSSEDTTSAGNIMRASLEERDPSGMDLLKKILYKYYLLIVFPTTRLMLDISSSKTFDSTAAVMVAINPEETALIPTQVLQVQDDKERHRLTQQFVLERGVWRNAQRQKINSYGTYLKNKMKKGTDCPIKWEDAMFSQLVKKGAKPTILYSAEIEQTIRHTQMKTPSTRRSTAGQD